MSYACTSADPPWAERGGGKVKRGADRHYPLLEVPEIIATMLGSPMWDPAPDSHLWLWVTDNFLAPAMSLVIPALGFRFIRTLCWVKESDQGNLQMGLGQYARGSHELCLLAVRGRGLSLVKDRAVPSAWRGPRGRHSAKPDGFYTERIERVSPGPRAELFAREPRAGWDVWGNDPAVAAPGTEVPGPCESCGGTGKPAKPEEWAGEVCGDCHGSGLDPNGDIPSAPGWTP